MAEEETNQSIETTETPAADESTDTEEIDFGEDDESTNSEESNEEEETETEQEAEPSEPKETETDSEHPQDTPFLDITYNKEKKSLSREEAITLAQKGMNYDKLVQKLQEQENSPVLKAFKAQAESVGLSLDDYAQRLSKFQEQSEIQQIADNFMATHPDVTDDVAKEYAEAEYKNQQIAKASKQVQQTQAQQKAENDSLVQEVQTFSERYPDVKIDKLPVEVIDDINSGSSLETAWLRYQNTQLNTRVKNEALNKSNKAKSVGKVSDNVSTSDGDSFLEGLLGK